MTRSDVASEAAVKRLGERTPFIESGTVALVPLTGADAAECYEWFVDEEVRSCLSSHHLPNTVERSREFIETTNLSDDDVLMGIVAKPEREYVGNIALHGIDWHNRNAFFGVAIGRRDFRGRGIGTESVKLLLRYAFKTLGLHLVFLNVFADNARAIRSYEKLGFSRAGTLPEAFARNGKFVDCVMMAMLDRDFKY